MTKASESQLLQRREHSATVAPQAAYQFVERISPSSFAARATSAQDDGAFS
jgi:hypothetical protein